VIKAMSNWAVIYLLKASLVGPQPVMSIQASWTSIRKGTGRNDGSAVDGQLSCEN